MADALDSKSSARKGVWVRLPPPVFSVAAFYASCWRWNSEAIECGPVSLTHFSSYLLEAGRFVKG